MSYGIQVTLDNGKTFDTNGFSCNTYDLISYTTNSGTQSKSYPELAGYKVYAMVQKVSNSTSDACATASVSYDGSGVPTVTYWTFVGGNTVTSYIYVVVS